jgi:5'-deoxynucleotidase YfbR-like HD superfamily hydrolase
MIFLPFFLFYSKLVFSKQKKDVKMSLEERIKKLIKDNHKEELESFLEKLEEKISLPQELQDILKKVGNNPSEEPKIFKLAENKAEFSEVLQEIISKDKDIQKKDIKMKAVELCEKHNLEEVILMCRLAVAKATDKINTDGSVKATPNTENCHLPNIFEAEEFMKKQQELEQCFYEYSKIRSSDGEIDEDILEKLNDKSTKLSKEIEKTALKISKLDGRKLNEWEKETVIMQIAQAVTKAYEKTSLGKHSSNS